MSNLNEQIKQTYRLRIKIRLDGRYCLVLSNEKPAYTITRDKEGNYHVIAKTAEWEYRMTHEGGLQDYLSKLLQCLEAYFIEAKDLDLRRIVLMQLFSDNKSPTI